MSLGSEQKVLLSLTKVKKALASLVLIANKKSEEDRSNIDATIQRFEFTVELFWKMLKNILETKGIEVQYPKDVLQEAYRGSLIDDEKVWIDMLRDRNLTSHTYDEAFADEVYARIISYVPVFKKNLDKIEKGIVNTNL